MNTATQPQLVSFGGLSSGFDSSIFLDEDRFRLWTPASVTIEGISKGSKTKPRLGRISGIATSEAPDEDQDIVDQEGLDWDYFIGKGGQKGHGLILLEHPVGVINTIGYPVSIELTEIKSAITGQMTKATKVTADLYLEDKMGRSTYKKARVMKRAGGQRSIGFSIEGGVQQRVGKRIAKARVKWLAVTAAPRNHDSWWEPMMMSANGATITKAQVGYPMQGAGYVGEIAPLVAQSLQGAQVIDRDKLVMQIAKTWSQELTWSQAESVFDHIVQSLTAKGIRVGPQNKAGKP